MRSVLSVEAGDFSLICELDDGKTYSYDMSFIKNSSGEMTAPLKALAFFKKVFIESGALAWPNGYDIHANTIEREGQLIKNEEAS